MKRSILSLCSLLLLTSCASAVEGSSQELTVYTPGANESVCYLENGMTRYKTTPPETIVITKSHRPLEVRCKADGNREKTIIVNSDWSVYGVGNIVTGMFPGVAYDLMMNAAHKYSAVIVVDFSDMLPRHMDAPAYQTFSENHPEMTGLEEFRVGMPALQEDYYTERDVLKRRDTLEALNQDSFVVMDSEGNRIGEADIQPVQSNTSAPVYKAVPKSAVTDKRLLNDASMMDERGIDDVINGQSR